jgi:hypothetical protein
VPDDDYTITVEVKGRHPRGPKPTLAQTARAVEARIRGLGELGFGIDTGPRTDPGTGVTGQGFASAHVQITEATAL